MQLIDYTPEWFGPVTRLFYESVHRSGGAAYSPEELEAWAPREMDFSSWEISLVRQHCVLALDDRGELCGFGDIDAEGGYLDRLYVRSDCQRQGVAGAICDRLEQLALDTGQPDHPCGCLPPGASVLPPAWIPGGDRPTGGTQGRAHRKFQDGKILSGIGVREILLLPACTAGRIVHYFIMEKAACPCYNCSNARQGPASLPWKGDG